MKIKAHGGELSAALAIAGGAVPSRAARPILQNVCLSARGDSLEILGTDMEIGVRHRVEEVEILEEGDVLVPAHRLQGIARELADGQIEIKSSGPKTEIRAPGSYFSLVGEEPGDFPVVPVFPDGAGVEIPSDLFSSLVRRTAFAAAAEETRYAIHGVLLEVLKDEIRMVATDGKRLAWSKAALKRPKGKKESALVPARGLAQVLKGMELGDEVVRLAFEERRIVAQTGRTTVSASRIQGTFPAYEEVVPAKPKFKATVDRDAFAACVRRGALLAMEGSHAVEVGFSPGKLTVGAKVSNVGEGELEMQAEYDGDALEINFNPRYILDFLKVAQGETIKVEMTDSRSAAAFHDGSGLLYVAMPITLETAS